MTAATLLRRTIKVRDANGKYSMVNGYECSGIGLVSHDIIDATATELAIEAWLVGDQQGNPPTDVVLSGFVLIHVPSGYQITPTGWLLTDFDTAKRCVRLLLDQYGLLFTGAVQAIQMLSSPVHAAHREAGAFTGRYDYLRKLDQSIDDEAYRTGLAALRANRPTAEHIERTAR